MGCDLRAAARGFVEMGEVDNLMDRQALTLTACFMVGFGCHRWERGKDKFDAIIVDLSYFPRNISDVKITRAIRACQGYPRGVSPGDSGSSLTLPFPRGQPTFQRQRDPNAWHPGPPQATVASPTIHGSIAPTQTPESNGTLTRAPYNQLSVPRASIDRFGLSLTRSREREDLEPSAPHAQPFSARISGPAMRRRYDR